MLLINQNPYQDRTAFGSKAGRTLVKDGTEIINQIKNVIKNTYAFFITCEILIDKKQPTKIFNAPAPHMNELREPNRKLIASAVVRCTPAPHIPISDFLLFYFINCNLVLAVAFASPKNFFRYSQLGKKILPINYLKSLKFLKLDF